MRDRTIGSAVSLGEDPTFGALAGRSLHRPARSGARWARPGAGAALSMPVEYLPTCAG